MSVEQELIIRIKAINDAQNAIRETNKQLADLRSEYSKLDQATEAGKNRAKEIDAVYSQLNNTLVATKNHFKELTGHVQSTHTSMGDFMKNMEGVGNVVKGFVAIEVIKFLGEMGQKIAEVSKQLLEFGIKGAEFGEMKKHFEEMNGGIDKAEQKLQLLRKASGNNLDDRSLLSYINKLDELNYSTEQSTKILDIATTKHHDLGITIDEATERITRFIETGNKKGLQSLGISYSDIITKTREWTKEQGYSYDKLDEASQRTARLTVFLDNYGQSVDQIKNKQMTESDSLQAIITGFENLKLKVQQFVAHALNDLIPKLRNTIETMFAAEGGMAGLEKKIQAVAEMLVQQFIPAVISVVTEVIKFIKNIESIVDSLDKLSGKGNTMKGFFAILEIGFKAVLMPITAVVKAIDFLSQSLKEIVARIDAFKNGDYLKVFSLDFVDKKNQEDEQKKKNLEKDPHAYDYIPTDPNDIGDDVLAKMQTDEFKKKKKVEDEKKPDLHLKKEPKEKKEHEGESEYDKQLAEIERLIALYKETNGLEGISLEAGREQLKDLMTHTELMNKKDDIAKKQFETLQKINGITKEINTENKKEADITKQVYDNENSLEREKVSAGEEALTEFIESTKTRIEALKLEADKYKELGQDGIDAYNSINKEVEKYNRELQKLNEAETAFSDSLKKMLAEAKIFLESDPQKKKEMQIKEKYHSADEKSGVLDQLEIKLANETAVAYDKQNKALITLLNTIIKYTKEKEKLEKAEAKYGEVVKMVADGSAKSFSDFWKVLAQGGEAGDAIKSVFKNILTTMVDYAEKQLVIAQIATITKAIASFGVLSGPAIAAMAVLALEEVALQGVKAAIGGMATGGLVEGPGTGTSDSVLKRLSAGEYVVKASSVNPQTLPFLNSLNDGKSSTSNINRFASTQAYSGNSRPIVHSHVHTQFEEAGFTRMMDKYFDGYNRRQNSKTT